MPIIRMLLFCPNEQQPFSSRVESIQNDIHLKHRWLWCNQFQVGVGIHERFHLIANLMKFFLSKSITIFRSPYSRHMLNGKFTAHFALSFSYNILNWVLLRFEKKFGIQFAYQFV